MSSRNVTLIIMLNNNQNASKSDAKPDAICIAIAMNNYSENTLNTTSAQEKKIDAEMLLAVEKNDLNLVRELLVQGANTNIVNSGGWAPAALAVMHNNADMIAALAAYGADLNAQSATGHTPLMLSVLQNSIDNAETLISLGAKFDQNSLHGELIDALASDVLNEKIVPALTALVIRNHIHHIINSNGVIDRATQSTSNKDEFPFSLGQALDYRTEEGVRVTDTLTLVLNSNIVSIASLLRQYSASRVVIEFSGDAVSGHIICRNFILVTSKKIFL